MKYKKFIIPAVVLVGGLLFIFKDRIFKKKSEPDYNDDNGSVSGSTRNDNFPSKTESKGSNVRDFPTATNPDAQRIALANNLKTNWEDNNNLKFVASQNTQIATYFYDIKKKVYKSIGIEIINAGSEIEKGRNISSIKINSQGFLTLFLKRSRSKFYVINAITVSPYAAKYE